MNHQSSDKDLITGINSHGQRSLKILFDRHYPDLCRVARRYVHDIASSEDIAQEVFVEIWKKREQLNIRSSVKGYLRKAVVNKSLNFIKSQRIQFEENNELVMATDLSNAQELLEEEELRVKIHRAISALPEKARIPFCLNRFEDLTYPEIAEKLDISVKTVEYQMSKALNILRKVLYFILILIFI